MTDTTTDTEWMTVAPAPAARRAPVAPANRLGPPKITLVRSGRRKALQAQLSMAAIRHLSSVDALYVVVARAAHDPRLIRLRTYPDLDRVPPAWRSSALRIRYSDQTVGGSTLLALMPVGTAVVLQPDGRDLMGRIPADVTLPTQEATA